MNTDFQKILKQLGKQAKKEAAEKQESEKNKQKQEYDLDFSQAVGQVSPLKNRQQYYAQSDKTPIKARPKDNRTDEENYFYIGSTYNDPPASFCKNGQGKNDIQRLKNGYYTVVTDVDLHGYTQEEAQKVLNEFIAFTQKRGVCGEIIHGSGLGSKGYKPVLKNMTRNWLMQHPDVLAYVEPREGNDGCVRILLKRKLRQQD
ncbi:Smr/MutS family protein [Neisseria gonorrhoeae]